MLHKFFSFFYLLRIETFPRYNQLKIITQLFLGILIDILAFPVLWIVCVYVRFTKKNYKRKIFIGCFPNNNYVYLAQALRNLNYIVTTLPLFIPPHEKKLVPYSYDIESKFPRLYKNWLGFKLINYGIFCYVILNHDILIMPFLNRLLDRMPLIQWYEYQFLKFAKKWIILNPFGSDVYTPHLSLKDKKVTTVLRDYDTDPFYSRINEDYIARIRFYGEKHAHKIIAALDLVDHLSRVDHLLQMRCIDLLKIKPFYEQKNDVFTVVHAINHRLLKGTQYLIDAVDKINKKKKLINLEILENTPNKIVLEKIKNADCVADQFLMGAYGRLAIESMALGKPVLCYLREDLFPLYPHWNECPVINTSIETIEQKLISLLNMSPKERKALGKKSRTYVEKYHSYEYVGQQLDTIIQSL